MANKVQIFNFQKNKIRTEVIDDVLQFVGKDIAEAIGYSDTTSALKTHVKNKYKRGWRITPLGSARNGSYFSTWCFSAAR